ncbi:unnamed protein product [Prunus armeniaca]|uniref:Uncharacterized protein n=1 Tax=Prunus armeniaca TaxID=36596 RepID=A0A6J5V962_PRUAR|nr:unnamed protein product [Prunus armeniaca]CAB4312827.1 unnamed protein product [Prunus armeniaca]
MHFNTTQKQSEHLMDLLIGHQKCKRPRSIGVPQTSRKLVKPSLLQKYKDMQWMVLANHSL